MADEHSSDEIHRADDIGRTRPQMSARHVIALILVALLVIIAVQNLERVPMDILFWDVRMPLIVLVTVAGVIGFVVGWLFFRARERRQRND
ncbi:MAG: LapA family protein [Acidimicrobiia bacterium]